MLYGAELRQTTLDNFFTVSKCVCRVIRANKIEKKFVQSSITKYMKMKK
jgi:hypothetical protein